MNGSGMGVRLKIKSIKGKSAYMLIKKCKRCSQGLQPSEVLSLPLLERVNHKRKIYIQCPKTSKYY